MQLTVKKMLDPNKSIEIDIQRIKINQQFKE